MMKELTWSFVLLLVVTPVRARAQACHGVPGRGAIAYEYGRSPAGTSQGASASIASPHTSLGVAAAVRDLGDITGQQGSLRFSLVFPASKLMICPGIGLIYQHSTWDPAGELSLTAHTLAARAGGGIGFEQEIVGGFSLTPYFVAQYEFALTAFNLDNSETGSVETQTTGDTASRGHFEYGLIGRYRSLYGGLALERRSDTHGQRPSAARWIVGFVLSAGRSTSSSPAAPRGNGSP